MLKRYLLAILLWIAATPVFATDYTDIWYVPAENGWGVNVVQSDKFMFVTFFIYGPDVKPTWYTGQLSLDTSGNYTGPLYATTGTFYGSPWNGQQLGLTQVGTVSFQPTSVSTAHLVYDVTTPAAMAAHVPRDIQRQTLTSIPIAGSYVGAQTGTYSGCTNPGTSGKYGYYHVLQVTQSGTNVSFSFQYDEGLQCTLTGTLTQTGQLLGVNNAAYSCTDGRDTTANVTDVKPTAAGITGRFTAANIGGGCGEDAAFSGVPR